MGKAREQILDILHCSEAGYHPQVWSGGWRVAYLNDTPRFHRENIVDMQRHNTSDEVFVLLEGHCTLYIGNGEAADVGEVTPVPMERGVLYNVRRGVWHTHVTEEGARLVIVENSEVSKDNSDYASFRIGEGDVGAAL